MVLSYFYRIGPYQSFLVEKVTIRATFLKWRWPLSELLFLSGEGYNQSYVFLVETANSELPF